MPDTTNETTPPDVTDLLLWRTATAVVNSHQPAPGAPGRCTHPSCRGTAWPCPPHQTALRAQRAARTPTGPTAVGRVPAHLLATLAQPHPHLPRRPPATRWAALTHPTPIAHTTPSPIHTAVLDLLRRTGPTSADELATRLRLPLTTTTDTLTHLHHAGLVTRTTHP